MPYAFQCKECGFVSEVPKGGGWSSCPDCGGNRVSTTKVKHLPAPRPAAAQPPAAGEERE